jgi:hypothetical protein
MRFFSLLDFQHWVLAVFLGMTGVILVYLAFGGYARRRTEGLEAVQPPGIPGEGEAPPRDEHNPIPPLLLVTYLGIVATAVGYMVFIGIRGPAF